MSQLHPVLRRYFSAIPAGSVGVGEGVFVRFGTRHRWLAPFLKPMQRRGVIVPGLHRDVWFRIENRTVLDGTGNGRAVAERTLMLDTGVWTMTDAVSLNPHGRVVDVLGEPGLVAASFDIETHDGALRMRSRAVGLRLGSLRMRLPRPIAPRIQLTERFDEATARQHVRLTIDAPVLGRVYEYGGSFVYRIEEES